jgi:hypothetical protein
VDGWLTSLSALGQGLAAMTVVLSVVIGVAVVVYRRRKSTRSIAHVESRAQEAVDGVVGVVSIKAATDEPVAHVVDDVVEAGDAGDDESLSRSPPMDDSSAGSAAGQLTSSDFSSFSLSSDERNADDQDDADGSEGGSCSDSDRGDDSDESTHSYRIFSL